MGAKLGPFEKKSSSSESASAQPRRPDADPPPSDVFDARSSRDADPSPRAARSAASRSLRSARSAAERAARDAIAAVLGLPAEGVSVEADFFELGRLLSQIIVSLIANRAIYRPFVALIHLFILPQAATPFLLCDCCNF